MTTTTMKQIPRKGLAAYFDAFTKRFLRDGSPEAVDVEVVARYGLARRHIDDIDWHDLDRFPTNVPQYVRQRTAGENVLRTFEQGGKLARTKDV